MKAVPIYLAMVGLPIAVMIPVLRMGRTLSAPPAVAGEWRSTQAGGPAIRVTQSGRYVDVELVDTAGASMKLSGRLVGPALTAAADGPGSLPCDATGELTLRLEFSAGARPDSASGVLTTPSAGCAPPPLHLRRMLAPSRVGNRR